MSGGGGSSGAHNLFAGGAAFGSATVELPSGVVNLLQSEAKRARKPLEQFLIDLLEAHSDVRASTKVMSDIRAGKSKAIPWEVARKSLIDAP